MVGTLRRPVALWWCREMPRSVLFLLSTCPERLVKCRMLAGLRSPCRSLMECRNRRASASWRSWSSDLRTSSLFLGLVLGPLFSQILSKVLPSAQGRRMQYVLDFSQVLRYLIRRGWFSFRVARSAFISRSKSSFFVNVFTATRRPDVCLCSAIASALLLEFWPYRGLSTLGRRANKYAHAPRHAVPQ